MRFVILNSCLRRRGGVRERDREELDDEEEELELDRDRRRPRDRSDFRDSRGFSSRDFRDSSRAGRVSRSWSRPRGDLFGTSLTTDL